MTVSKELEAEIARLFFAEGWKVGTIARQLGVHHDVVRRVLGRLPQMPSREPQEKTALVTRYTGFIAEQLERYPDLRSTRLLDMVRARGFEGSARTLSRYVQRVRPK